MFPRGARVVGWDKVVDGYRRMAGTARPTLRQNYVNRVGNKLPTLPFLIPFNKSTSLRVRRKVAPGDTVIAWHGERAEFLCAGFFYALMGRRTGEQLRMKVGKNK